MTVPQDVITDLLPLYYSGEASADTRALVDEYFRANPAFARAARATEEKAPILAEAPADADRSAESAVIERTRRMVKRRSWTLALAILFTAMPLAVGFSGHGLTFFMLRDVPASRWMWVAAAWLWFQYVRLNRQLGVV